MPTGHSPCGIAQSHHQLSFINHLSSILLQKMPISGKNVELIISASSGKPIAVEYKRRKYTIQEFFCPLIG